MSRIFHLALALLFASPLALSAETGNRPAAATAWENSIVRLEVSRLSYDQHQPWNRRTVRSQKTGLVVADREILTTAQDLSDATLVRVQKEGRGPWSVARIAWVDYHANLALITSEEDSLWRGLQPAPLAATPPTEDLPLRILRWREGKLENRRAELTQFAVRQSQLSLIHHVQLELDSEIKGAGSGEPVVMNSHVAGLLAEQRDRSCQAIPASFIRAILAARQRGLYRGLGYFHFYWQRAENPATAAYLRLSGQPRGALVIRVPERLDGLTNVLQARDLILQMDGFDVDQDGDYTDPDYGPLMLENLASRGRWAGEDIPMKIWRDGQMREITYRLPKYEYQNFLVPYGVFDQPPEYLIVGGLVFQPLTFPYLQRWGPDWERRAPFRLNFFTGEEATRERPGLVVFSQVLPDAFNLGYQEQRFQTLLKVNGRPVHTLTDLRAALQSPVNGFHILDLLPGDASQRIVLHAGEAEREATRRVLTRFGIEKEFFIAPPVAR